MKKQAFIMKTCLNHFEKFLLRFVRETLRKTQGLLPLQQKP